MASDDTQFCTDEELLQELKKLGYNDVSAEAFLMVKKDLFELMHQEKKVPINWQNYYELTSYKNMKYPDQSRDVIQPTAFLPGRSPTFVIDPLKTSPGHYASTSADVPDLPQNKAKNLKSQNRTQNLSVKEEHNNHSLPTSFPISDLSPTKSKNLKFQNGTQNLSVKEDYNDHSLPTSSPTSDLTPTKPKNQSENYKPKERTRFHDNLIKKQPEFLPSNVRNPNASPKQSSVVSKRKTQIQKSLLEEEIQNISPISSEPNVNSKALNFASKEKTQRQTPLVEKGNNLQARRREVAKNNNFSLSPSLSPNRNKHDESKFKGIIPKQNPSVKFKQENLASYSSLIETNSIPRESENTTVTNQCNSKKMILKQNPSVKFEQENLASYSSSIKTNSTPKESENSTVTNRSISEEDQENTEAISDASKSTDSPGTSISNISFDEYRERLKTFKAGRESKSPEKKDSSSVSLEGNKIKRKVLRHKNGKPVVTEEYIEIPSIFNTSVSSDSSGSLSAASPETSDTPRSTDSLSSSRSVLSRYMPGKKKSDPVAMYHYYKKFWNEHKPPGEKSHGKLRWAVRDRMLEYSL